jgi:hypothetical protein
MNEFVLQGWERELNAWERRLHDQPSSALSRAVHALASQIEELRRAPVSDERRAADEIRDQFERLRRLYEAEPHPRA